jgi:Gas vesicle synthesis protein GvpL/GvpF
VVLLPYCVVLTESFGKVLITGVRGAEVLATHVAELTAFYSEIEKERIVPEQFQDAALEFHRVVHAALANAAVVPFRFPTWISNEELVDHLKDQAERYRSFLTQYADHVQMELRLTLAPGKVQRVFSGTEHLRARAAQLHQVENAAEEAKRLLAGDVIEWRERDVAEGKRLFALVKRGEIASFRERLSGRGLSWSGPWPAMEFLGK